MFSDVVLGWTKQHQKTLYLTDISSEVLLQMWGLADSSVSSVAIFPVLVSQNHQGMIAVLEPKFKLDKSKIQRHLDVISGLIQSGIRNRLLYKKLKYSEEEFRDLFENASTMAAVVYPDGIIRGCNNSFSSTLDIQQDPKGLNIHDIIREVSENRFDQCWDALLRSSELSSVPLKLYTMSNAVKEIQLSGNAKLNEQGFPRLIRLYMQDVTTQKAAERKQHELELEVERSQQRQLAQMGMYVSGIAHNLQNPVQVLLGYVELLKYEDRSFPELTFIEQSTHNIMKIIQNLLYKMNQEKKTEETDVNLNELLDNELTFLNANHFFKHNIQKDYLFSHDLPLIHGVYSDFSQSIMNIVYNAIDAMSDCAMKKLTVETLFNAEKNEIIVAISDTGKGISEENKTNIFHPFFSTKAEQSTTHGITSGSGLGLSSSLGLLKAYNGRIDFTSEVGKGTTFYIILPVGDNYNE